MEQNLSLTGEFEDDDSMEDANDMRDDDYVMEDVNRKEGRMCKWNERWTDEFIWLKKENDKEGKCSNCSIVINFSYRGRSSLVRHDSSQTHQKRASIIENNASPHDSYAVARVEAAIAYQWVHHNLPYNALGSLIDVLKETVTDSEIIKKVHMKRTKATKIVENVIGPASIRSHIENIEKDGLPFGIQIDASNIHGNKKLFPIVILYWKKGLHYFVLDVIETADESSDAIWEMITDTLAHYELNVGLLSAFMGDNASVNFGKNHSVWTHSKQNNEYTLKGRCFAHVIHNGFKHAINALSFNVERLIMKTYSHFSKSAQRSQGLKDLTPDDEKSYATLKRHVSVRFLSLTECAVRLVKLWKPVIDYFRDMNANNKAKMLLFEEECENLEAKASTEFLAFVGSMLNSTTLLIEQKDCLQVDLQHHLLNLLQKISYLKDHKEFGNNAKITVNDMPAHKKVAFVTDIMEFYDIFITYLNNYLSDEDIKEQVKILSPFCLMKSKFPAFSECLDVIEFFPELADTMDEDMLLDEILTLNNNKEEIFANSSFQTLPTSAQRWAFVTNTHCIPLIESILSRIMIVTATTAYIERSFSMINNKWTSDRANSSIKLIGNELRTHMNFSMNPLEFSKFIKTQPELLAKITSKEKY